MIRQGQTLSLQTLAAQFQWLVLVGFSAINPIAIASRFCNKTWSEKDHTNERTLTANGGLSVGDCVVNGTLSTIVNTVPQGQSTVPAGDQRTSAGCPDCAAAWEDMRPGDACPSCYGTLLGLGLAISLAEMRGNL